MEVLAVQSCLTLCDPHGLQPTRLLCPWYSPGTYIGMGSQFISSGHLPDPSLEPRSSEPPGKPKFRRHTYLDLALSPTSDSQLLNLGNNASQAVVAAAI